MPPELENFFKTSVIGRGMDKYCRLAVTIPVYDEQPEMILSCLVSLSRQQKANNIEQMEVIINVNNKLSDAQEQTKVYFSNQETLKLLKFLNGSDAEFYLPPENLTKAKEIKASGLNICILDCSSEKFAQVNNNIGLARNFAGWLACYRFGQIKQQQGLIALTDIDCEFSENYLLEILKTFKQHSINGLSGRFEYKLDKTLPYPDLTLRALEAYIGSGEFTRRNVSFKPNLRMQKANNIPYTFLSTGQNMVVTAATWKATLGVPPVRHGEDLWFGFFATKLPGDVARNTAYSVRTLTRVSQKAGLGSFGRKIHLLQESIKNYEAGNSDRVKLFNPDGVSRLINALFMGHKQPASALDIEKIFKAHYCELSKDGLMLLPKFANLVNTVRISGTITDRQFAEDFLLDHYYNFLPSVDVTGILFDSAI